MEMTEKQQKAMNEFVFLYLLDKKADSEFQKRVKESGLEHEKRGRMQQVLLNSISEYEKRIAELQKYIDDMLSKHDYLHEMVECWEEGLTFKELVSALKQAGKL